MTTTVSPALTTPNSLMELAKPTNFGVDSTVTYTTEPVTATVTDVGAQTPMTVSNVPKTPHGKTENASAAIAGAARSAATHTTANATVFVEKMAAMDHRHLNALTAK
jgi:hypothetical protein